MILLTCDKVFPSLCSYEAGEHTIEATTSLGSDASSMAVGSPKTEDSPRSGPPEDGSAARDDSGAASTARRGHYPLVAVVETTAAPESPSAVVSGECAGVSGDGTGGGGCLVPDERCYMEMCTTVISL